MSTRRDNVRVVRRNAPDSFQDATEIGMVTDPPVSDVLPAGPGPRLRPGWQPARRLGRGRRPAARSGRSRTRNSSERYPASSLRIEEGPREEMPPLSSLIHLRSVGTAFFIFR